jgi:hypothetical protein
MKIKNVCKKKNEIESNFTKFIILFFKVHNKKEIEDN